MRSVDLTSGVHRLLTLFLATQTRVQNIPLLLVFDAMMTPFSKSLPLCVFQIMALTRFTCSLVLLRISPTDVAITTILLAHVSFFAMGNTNAISSIDLSNAYNGVSGYNVIAVGALIFISNWVGPIYWASAAAILMKYSLNPTQRARLNLGTTHVRKMVVPRTGGEVVDIPLPEPKVNAMSGKSSNAGEKRQSPYLTFVCVNTLFMCVMLLAVMMACTALRTHLFIWTVFSPKYLYAMAWAVAFHLGVNICLGAFMWRVAVDQEVLE